MAELTQWHLGKKEDALTMVFSLAPVPLLCATLVSKNEQLHNL